MTKDDPLDALQAWLTLLPALALTVPGTLLHQVPTTVTTGIGWSSLLALPAIDTGKQWLVPVVRYSLRVAGSLQRIGSGVGGSGSTQFVGAWIESPGMASTWLPGTSVPPDDCADWNTWLSAREDLLDEIHRRIATARQTAP